MFFWVSENDFEWVEIYYGLIGSGWGKMKVYLK